MGHGLSVLLLSCYLLNFSGSIERRSGPYDWVLEKLDSCPDPGSNESEFATKMTKVSRNRAVLNGTIRVGPDIDEESKVDVEVQEWGNQGYRPRSFLFSFRKCSTMWREAGDKMKDMFVSAGLNLTGCPVPAGNYSGENIIMDFRIAKVPVMIYNKVRVIFRLYHGKKKVGCTIFYGEFVPKTGP